MLEGRLRQLDDIMI